MNKKHEEENFKDTGRIARNFIVSYLKIKEFRNSEILDILLNTMCNYAEVIGLEEQDIHNAVKKLFKCKRCEMRKMEFKILCRILFFVACFFLGYLIGSFFKLS